MFWYPIYWVDGAVKFLTGLVSLFTAISLFMVVPKMLEVAPKEMLDRAISDKVHAELKAELLQANLDVWNEATQAKIDMLRDRYSALRNKK